MTYTPEFPVGSGYGTLPEIAPLQGFFPFLVLILPLPSQFPWEDFLNKLLIYQFLTQGLLLGSQPKTVVHILKTGILQIPSFSRNKVRCGNTEPVSTRVHNQCERSCSLLPLFTSLTHFCHLPALLAFEFATHA